MAVLVILDFPHEKKIQAIKGIRSVAVRSEGIPIGLREAKEILDHVQMGEIRHITIEGDPTEAIYMLNSFGVKAERAEPTPLPVHMLALKLAMRGLSIKEVENLADDLHGIEDAAGSLREAAKMMLEVQP